MESDVQVRDATPADVRAIVRLCRHGWRAWVAWFAPSIVICGWWVRVLESSDCFVRVASIQVDEPGSPERVVGFSVLASDFEAWDRMLHRGPHSKLAKVLILLWNPRLLALFLKKRRVRSAPRATNKAAHAGSEGVVSTNTRSVNRCGVVNSSSEFHLALMAVDKTVRGKGLGSAIVRDYLALAELRSADSVWLHVEPLNTRAQSLYKKHGFMIVGRDGNSLLMIRGTGGAGKSCAEQEL